MQHATPMQLEGMPDGRHDKSDVKMKEFTCEACLQGEYCLSYGAVGTRVALIASEPITGQAGDWVAVPNNTALVVISEKVGLSSNLQIDPLQNCLRCTVLGDPESLPRTLRGQC